MTRHLGKIAATNEEIVVHYMLIPEQTTNALVTRTTRLTGALRSEVLAALTSSEGQHAVTFADVLGRKLYADSGRSLFRVLHEQGMIESVTIDEVVMTPQGNNRIPLRTVLEAINQLPKTAESDARFNPHTHNVQSDLLDSAIQIAHNLLAQADMIERDAYGKREEAYRIAPSLRPQSNPAPEFDHSLVEGAPVVAEVEEAQQDDQQDDGQA